ncbi:hypothetical protein GCM10007275_16240 [Jeotgalicoccus coquinae]|uniref:Uncharacterized protein n=1 Tax=Jeotgalicoccus coquinae TaxID=709509 RepID=A0A6V7R1F2_9STAP|nr:hypothetical protein [Jeotgalicoccus coquinae]MBB6423702.1 hypothetical protein [Jeotgalicoccus coquinae]GGE21939.1 hypothetical protein GCM10007275_16240 [Jeotgalicoccus coquinae]CAD2071035.1 hypothetical protein JEOCOQ751_00106 [Jeotgalicoccus coquinae]
MPINKLLLSRKFSWVYLVVLIINIFVYTHYQGNIWGMMPIFVLLGFMTIYSFLEIDKQQKNR